MTSSCGEIAREIKEMKIDKKDLKLANKKKTSVVCLNRKQKFKGIVFTVTKTFS